MKYYFYGLKELICWVLFVILQLIQILVNERIRFTKTKATL